MICTNWSPDQTHGLGTETLLENLTHWYEQVTQAIPLEQIPACFHPPLKRLYREASSNLFVLRAEAIERGIDGPATRLAFEDTAGHTRRELTRTPAP